MSLVEKVGEKRRARLEAEKLNRRDGVSREQTFGI